MSERGSFVTSYIYCNICFGIAKKIFLDKKVLEDAVQINDLPIIAGRVHGTYAGEELHVMQSVIKEIEHLICHQFHVAVIPDSADPEVFLVRPWEDRHDNLIINVKQSDDYLLIEKRCFDCGMLVESLGHQAFIKPHDAKPIDLPWISSDGEMIPVSTPTKN